MYLGGAKKMLVVFYFSNSSFIVNKSNNTFTCIIKHVVDVSC